MKKRVKILSLHVEVFTIFMLAGCTTPCGMLEADTGDDGMLLSDASAEPVILPEFVYVYDWKIMQYFNLVADYFTQIKDVVYITDNRDNEVKTLVLVEDSRPGEFKYLIIPLAKPNEPPMKWMILEHLGEFGYTQEYNSDYFEIDRLTAAQLHHVLDIWLEYTGTKYPKVIFRETLLEALQN